MGNQLISSVKTVIRPIDYYLAEVPEYKFKASLGQTQFLKVALCSTTDGDVVVKVLSHEDPSLLLKQYRNALIEFAQATASNLSIAAFQIVKMHPNFAYMVRQFIKFSLYDRLSTRPFLTDIEKAWIAYQILKCLAWCHERSIFHGDIKLENILITSSQWVVLSDFATCKPTLLADDNPSFFNYFFDTSRRRCCNIAPERFVGSNQLQNLENITAYSSSLSASIIEQQLTDRMDMFSLGCVLAELFSDEVLFDLSTLLAYKESKFEKLDLLLSKIENIQIRPLVKSLVSLNPQDRPSAQSVLSNYRSILFPSYFDSLYRLFKVLITLSPDTKILYLCQELENQLPAIVEEDPRGLLLLLDVVVSTLRSLKHVHCKLVAQKIILELVRLAPEVTESIITDRLIPYFAHLLSDSEQKVRGAATNAITELLEKVQKISNSDNTIFTDYLMDIFMRRMLAEKSTYVRLCIAQNVGRLSRVALRFLNQSCDHNYDEELSLLHSYFQNLVAHLLTDSNHAVRRTLLLTPESCAHLCTFFGRQKTNDIILSHIITFLNDKNDFQLRSNFFDNITVIASFLGVACSPILYPLLQQGLCDAEEIIVSKTISSISALAEQDLLQKNIIYELLSELLPFLYHPNQWIVHSVVSFLRVLGEHLSFIDMNCKVLPMLAPYLTRNVHSLSSPYLLLDSLHRPLMRSIYDIVMDNGNSNQALEGLFEILDFKLKKVTVLRENADTNNSIYKRLVADNVTETAEEQLHVMSSLLIKIHRNKRNYIQNQSRKSPELNNINFRFIRSIRLDRNQERGSTSDYEVGTSANQEWQHMFGARSGYFEKIQSSSTETPTTSVSEAEEAREFDYSQFECPLYSRDVRFLLKHKRSSFQPIHSSNDSRTTAFRPYGELIANLQEHKSNVNQLAKYSSKDYFLSCSDDGTLRVWDLRDIDNQYVINRSKYMIKMELANGLPMNFKGITCCDDTIITFTEEGLIYVFQIFKDGLSLLCRFKPGKSSSSGHNPMLITSICSLSSNMFFVTLSDSYAYGYDIRKLNTVDFSVPAFKLRIAPNLRTITTADGNDVVLFMGTASGHYSAFDLRFLLEVKNWRHLQSTTCRIARIKYTPEGLFSSVYGSPEIVVWDYKLGQRSRCLMLHQTSRNTDRKQPDMSIVQLGLLPISTPNGNALISGGSDSRIRYWDLNQPERSYVISDVSHKQCSICQTMSNERTAQTITSGRQIPVNVYSSFQSGQIRQPIAMYQHHQNSDIREILEVDTGSMTRSTVGPISSNYYCAHDQQFVSPAHSDTITDLICVNGYLVSTGRSGTIKVWH